MSNIQFKTNVITSDGAALLEQAKKTNDKVILLKALSIEKTFDRNEAANVHFSDVKQMYREQNIEESNVATYFDETIGDDSLSTVSVNVLIDGEMSFSPKGFIILANLASNVDEETFESTSEPVAFAVLCDDNIILNENVEFTFTLPVSSQYLQQTAESPINKSFEQFKTSLDVYEINSDDEVQTGGLRAVLRKENCYDATFEGDKIPVAAFMEGENLSIVTGNGTKYTISGATIIKSTVMLPEVKRETWYWSDQGIPTVDSVTNTPGNGKYFMYGTDLKKIPYNENLKYNIYIPNSKNDADGDYEITHTTGSGSVLQMNRTNATIRLVIPAGFVGTYATCNDSRVTNTVVYNESDKKFNAFKITIDEIDYYFILDMSNYWLGWISDLSAYGYHIVSETPESADYM